MLSLSPEVFALQLDSLTLDGAGVLQPFVAAESTSTGFGIIVGQDLNSPASSSLTLNYVQLPVYVIFASLCEPQSLSAFAPAGQSMDYSACSTTASTIQRFHITVSLVHVDLPPVFMVASFNISASGVGSAGMSIWQPLSYFVTNPDPVYPYNVTSYRVVSGKCNHTSVSASDIVLPVSIWPGNGSLYYTVSGGLGNYSSPMLLCVLAVGGGGLYASANVSLWLSTVQQQLSVQPAYVNVTHYSPGTSSVVVSVAYDPGSTVNGSWGVSVQHPGWSSAVKLSETAFSVVLNSAGLSNSSQSLFVSTALVYTAGA